MTSHPLEKAAAVATLALSACILLMTPWPDIDRLLGISSEQACRSLPKPHPDCSAINGAKSHN